MLARKPTILSGRDLQKYHNRAVCRRVVAAAEASEFKTLEAFVTHVARLCVVDNGVPKVTVRAEKPSALVFADCSGVEITRSARDFA